MPRHSIAGARAGASSTERPDSRRSAIRTPKGTNSFTLSKRSCVGENPRDLDPGSIAQPNTNGRPDSFVEIFARLPLPTASMRRLSAPKRATSTSTNLERSSRNCRRATGSESGDSKRRDSKVATLSRSNLRHHFCAPSVARARSSQRRRSRAPRRSSGTAGDKAGRGHRAWSILRSREHVSGAPNGDDPARLLRIVFDVRPDARDVDVDRPVECLEGLTLDEVHERLARHDATRALGERNEQLELIARQCCERRRRYAPRVRRDRSPVGRTPARRPSACPFRGAGSLAGAPEARGARMAWAGSHRRPAPAR